MKDIISMLGKNIALFGLGKPHKKSGQIHPSYSTNPVMLYVLHNTYKQYKYHSINDII
jgi:hypothetical protein